MDDKHDFIYPYRWGRHSSSSMKCHFIYKTNKSMFEKDFKNSTDEMVWVFGEKSIAVNWESIDKEFIKVDDEQATSLNAIIAKKMLLGEIDG